MNDLIEVSGEIVRKIRKDSGWTKLVIRDGQKDTTLIGNMPNFSEGMRVKAKGTKSVHETFGEQINVVEISEDGFNSTESLIKYLAGDAFKNIGMAYARKIVDHFGMDTLQVLDQNIERIFEVPGLPESRAQALMESWSQERDVHKLMASLMGFGMTVTIAIKVHKHFGDNALSIISADPYSLTQVPGIGFVKADEIALRSGIARNSPQRCDAATRYVMDQSLMSGHCYVYKSILGEDTVKLLNREVNTVMVSESIRRLVADSILTVEDDRAYLTGIYDAEHQVSEMISAMCNYSGKTIYYDNIDDFRVMLASNGITDLDSNQEMALFNTMNNRVSVITGGPGVGKSFVTKALITLLQANGIDYMLCAPTGRASKRLAEATGEPAQTIHRLLGFREGAFQYNLNNPLPTACVIVDEASMVDLTLLRHLLLAMEKHQRLIFVGDVDQLPSVGPGNILRDVINSGTVSVTRLTKIFRQKAGSTIITTAHDILHGITPDLPTPAKAAGRNCMMVVAEEQENLIQSIITLVSKSLPSAGYSIHDIQVLTPMRGKGLGVEDLNPRLQAVLNPPSEQKAEVQAGIRIFRVGDRIMQIRNNYQKAEEAGGVFNGDLGVIAGVSKVHDTTTVFVKYPDINELVSYSSDEWDELQHAFACTVHKSQGAEYPAVVLVIHPSQYNMLQRNLFYTGLTRAKKICIVAGTNRAVEAAVTNDKEIHRNTTLCELLQS